MIYRLIYKSQYCIGTDVTYFTTATPVLDDRPNGSVQRTCWLCACVSARLASINKILSPVVSLLPSGLPSRTIAYTVSSELLVFFTFSLFFVSVPCARLSCPSRQLLSARLSTVSYRNVIRKQIGLVLAQRIRGTLQTTRYTNLPVRQGICIVSTIPCTECDAHL